MGWVDDRTLLVTAQIDKGQFWELKVMRVDVRSRKAKELFRQGVVICTNPAEGVASVAVGSFAGSYAGGSKEPSPERKVYQWNATLRVLIPKFFRGGWDGDFCVKTKPRDGEQSTLRLSAEETRYLDAKDGTLEFESGMAGGEPRLALTRNNKRIAILDAQPEEIGLTPRYLPYRQEYLLATGSFLMNAVFTRKDGRSTSEQPIITMDKSGRLRREYLRPVFHRYGLVGDGHTLPYAKGTMILFVNRPQDGGGIYLKQGESVKRVWCTNDGKVHDRMCSPSRSAMSPDGCHFAFFAKGSDALTSTYSTAPTLQVLRLCT